jgi:hypothetical protein
MIAITVNNQGTHYNRPPNICPLCQHAVEPRHLAFSLNGGFNHADTELQIAFQCVRDECRSMFIGYYRREPSALLAGQPFLFRRSAPINSTPPPTPHEVSAMSSQFVTIRGQAAAADAYGLNEIAGGGYRKALEFLIKDFCISQRPEHSEAIRKAFLAAVIKEYVDDANIKACAERAAWLGNDETHYVKQWGEKDIRDLKVLIELTVNWIRSHVLTQHYLKEMP